MSGRDFHGPARQGITRRKSVQVWTWRRMLRDHGPRKPGLLLTLHTIGTWMDGDGYCHPSQKSIAKGARASDRTIRRHVEQAVALGWLHTEAGPMGGQRWRRTAYQATVPLDVEMSDHDEELTDVLHSWAGDVGDEYEDPASEGADSIVSSPCTDETEKVRTSEAKVRTPVTEGADTGDQKVRTQYCPTNSPVNSPIELSNTEGTTDVVRLPQEENERAGKASHILDVLPDHGPPNRSLQGKAITSIDDIDQKRRARILQLAGLGHYGVSQIATFAGVQTDHVRTILEGSE